MFHDYYNILNISSDADDNEIKNAYKVQAIKWHPDKNIGVDTTERMQLINEAFLILHDPEARQKYDFEYKKYKAYQEAMEKEPGFSDKEYIVEDELLKSWMENARKQAVNLAKQTLKDFKDIGIAGLKGAAKQGGGLLIGFIIIAIVITIAMAIIGQ
jgi:DnaJ-class molecular chaperone